MPVIICKGSLNCNCATCKRIANLFICKSCGSRYKLDNVLTNEEYKYVCSNRNCKNRDEKKSRKEIETPMKELFKDVYDTEDSWSEEESDFEEDDSLESFSSDEEVLETKSENDAKFSSDESYSDSDSDSEDYGIDLD